MPIPVNVFISYRIESKKHSQQVISLAGRLRAEGINAIIDRYIEAPKEGWPRWIGRQIEEADFVLCVCTPGYRTAFEGRNEPDGGLGVNAEGYYIMQDLYEHGNESDKYIPVLFLGSTGDIPRMLRAFRRYYLPSEYEDLYRRLTGQPSVRQPAIGPRKELPLPKKAPPLWKERIRSGGFEGQDERHFSITPHDYSLAQLAPSEGIALSRIINPPDRFDSSVITTVWVAARGEDQYIIDSVRIKDWAGMPLGPSGGPVLAPDAEYQFTFGEGTDRTHALNPALSVGPQTRPYASFNFCLTPNTPLYTLGHVRVTLNYHTLGGRYGTLMLAQPDKAGVMLARHLRQDMCVSIQDSRYGYDYSEQVVTQEGLQKGYERDFHEYPQYIPIDLLKLELYELGSRKALHHLRNSLNGFFRRARGCTTCWIRKKVSGSWTNGSAKDIGLRRICWAGSELTKRRKYLSGALRENQHMMPP